MIVDDDNSKLHSRRFVRDWIPDWFANGNVKVHDTMNLHLNRKYDQIDLMSHINVKTKNVVLIFNY